MSKSPFDNLVARHGEDTFHSVSFERRYRDKEGNWQTSHSFDTEDLLSLAKLADQTHSRILELRGTQAE